MPYGVRFRRRVRRTMVDFPAQDFDRVTAAIEELSNQPRPPGVVKMQGGDLWRIRVGDYRVVYHINDQLQEIIVVRAEHRGVVYRGL